MRRSRTTAVPPAPIGRARPLVPRQFWLTLTVESRERILGTLSRDRGPAARSASGHPGGDQ